MLYRQSAAVEEIIRQRCERLGVPLHLADFDGIWPESAGLEGQVFDWEDLDGLRLPLLGRHQLCNAAVALTAIRVLQARGWAITDSHIRRGLASTDWPGRFQIIGHDPLFIIDGGHNPQCIQALEQNIRDYLPGRPLTVLIGVMQDKDYHCMYRGVAPYANSFITVTPDNPRSLPAGELAAYIRELGCSATACGTIREGVALALEQAGPDGTVLCYGSLYLIGDVELQLRELTK